MPSTFTTNIGIEKVADTEQDGTWGETLRKNWDVIDQATNGIVSVTLASAGTTGSPNDIPITNATLSDGRNRFIEFVDGGDLGGTAYVRITPNDAEKIVHIRNSLSGSQDILIFQGTYNASNDFLVPNGADVLLKFDGGGTGATVTDMFVNLTPTGLTVTNLTVTTITAGTYVGLPTADLTTQGIVELATVAETNAGTDATRAVTPDGLDGWTGSAQVTTLGTIATGTWQGDVVAEAYLENQSGTNTGDEVSATDTTEGIVELATQAEVDAGSDTSRVVTPATLSSYSGLPGNTLAGLSDTTLTSLGDDEILLSASGSWINQTLAEAGIAALASPTFVGTVTIPTLQSTGPIVEYTDTMPAGTTPAIDPANGTVQEWTLTGNSSPTDSLADGESVCLHIDDGTAYTVTWPTTQWVGGSAPTLDTAETTVVQLWKVGSTLYGSLVGVVS